MPALSSYLDRKIATAGKSVGVIGDGMGKSTTFICRYRITDIGRPIVMWGFKWWRGNKRGWLRPTVISIVSRSPKNGAEIMDEIEKMSWGYWRPSPGSVYPLLDELTQEGLLTKRDDGKYEVSDKGKEESMWPFGAPLHGPQSVDEMMNEIGGYVSYLEDLARSDKSRIAPYSDRIKSITERLSKLQ